MGFCQPPIGMKSAPSENRWFSIGRGREGFRVGRVLEKYDGINSTIKLRQNNSVIYVLHIM